MSSEKIKIIFLDRDGVINRERGEYTFRKEDFILNDGLVEALKICSEKKYQFVVISNQSGIAKGIYTKEDVENLHLHLKNILANHGIEILEMYYCPHHPDVGKCLCRKPGSLLLEKAIARFDVDAANSYFIGDAERDAEAGKKAGVKTILIAPNSSLTSVIHLVN
ncbi:MAG: HAD family hydrolase [Bacteroidetes bacterium]|nr:HAD family hydrolase [Bacteroidota bacterium]